MLIGFRKGIDKKSSKSIGNQALISSPEAIGLIVVPISVFLSPFQWINKFCSKQLSANLTK